MTDEHHGRVRMSFGKVLHTGNHARLDGRDGLATGWSTGRIRLPLLVPGRVVSAARQNLSAAQAFPRPHSGFNEPWFGDDGQPVGFCQRQRRRDGPRERTRVDRRQSEGGEGVGELLRLPLATLR
jgi:hypothetical protein